MADVPDGPHRADVRPGAPFPAFGERAGALRHRALHEGEGPSLRSSRPAPGRGGIPRRRVFDRRYRHLSLGRALRVAQDRLERFSKREALVRRDRREAGGEARNGRAFLNQPLRAYLARKALISSILSCGSSGSWRVSPTPLLPFPFFFPLLVPARP